ncbi:MAG TPA: hypothetical protein VGE52_20685 [Pirellulales bacterium]
MTLSTVATCSRRTVGPGDRAGPFLVLDTSDAREGIVVGRKSPTRELGSLKKSLAPGDVIVSRLRPYLRQVAFIDAEFAQAAGGELLASTEFFVLRPLDTRSLAFLVPFLLSDRVQAALAASQEGGHHPRFDEATLLALPLAPETLARRDATSAAVEQAIALHRRSERVLSELIGQANAALAVGVPPAGVPDSPVTTDRD